MPSDKQTLVALLNGLLASPGHELTCTCLLCHDSRSKFADRLLATQRIAIKPL